MCTKQSHCQYAGKERKKEKRKKKKKKERVKKRTENPFRM
jgi:hypothetical protein